METVQYEVKRVGKSGQISIGRQYEGQLFQEEIHPGGVIVLRPVTVLPKDSWLARDQGMLRKALAWAAENPVKETKPTELKALAKRVKGDR